jgi:diadenosine tetraphosphate (Ap4A) HIT family hydrolase
MNCKFCNVASLHERQYTADQILFETESFFAISSIGGFIPGWVLICTKAHQLNLSTLYANKYFLEFVSDVQEVVTKKYGRCVIFEHGAVSEGSKTACGTNHAHLHIVPFSKSIQTLALQQDASLAWNTCEIEKVSQIADGAEYFFCADNFIGNKTSGFISVLQQPQSQFFRVLLSHAVGLAEFYDYKRYPIEEISGDTTQRLGSAFAIEKTTL